MALAKLLNELVSKPEPLTTGTATGVDVAVFVLGVGAVGSNPLPAPLGLATLSEMSHACSFFWISSTGDGESLREQPQRPASGRDRSEPSR